ncbi:MAG TPA: SRPBCC family protein [Opitutaceae bacterium]|nr:SRPBCC family protein [Opitutaceae bacterium]
MNQPVQAVVLHRFTVPAERVFDAWLDVTLIGRWMFGPAVRDERIVRIALEPHVGGKFSFVVNRQGTEVDHVGEYLEIDRPRLLVFTWTTRDSLPDTSRVIVEIAPLDRGCEVKVTHVMAPGWEPFVDKAAGGWTKMLTALERMFAPPGRREVSSSPATSTSLKS